MIKNISDFVSQISLGRSIEGVLITPDKIVATDSFKLIEIKQDTGAIDPYIVKLPKGLKTFDTTLSDGTINYKGAKYQGEILTDPFPDYGRILPKEEDKPDYTTILDIEALQAILKAFSNTTKGFNHIKIEFYPQKQGLAVFTKKDTDMRAVLMPVVK